MNFKRNRIVAVAGLVVVDALILLVFGVPAAIGGLLVLIALAGYFAYQCAYGFLKDADLGGPHK